MPEAKTIEPCKVTAHLMPIMPMTPNMATEIGEAEAVPQPEERWPGRCWCHGETSLETTTSNKILAWVESVGPIDAQMILQP